jgi:hypothetical protein
MRGFLLIIEVDGVSPDFADKMRGSITDISDERAAVNGEIDEVTLVKAISVFAAVGRAEGIGPRQAFDVLKACHVDVASPAIVIEGDYVFARNQTPSDICYREARIRSHTHSLLSTAGKPAVVTNRTTALMFNSASTFRAGAYEHNIVMAVFVAVAVSLL